MLLTELLARLIQLILPLMKRLLTGQVASPRVHRERPVPTSTDHVDTGSVDCLQAEDTEGDRYLKFARTLASVILGYSNPLIPKGEVGY